ncbi:hypothetical protein BV25DRAFT_1822228 [Artomyces pyxidatus]|uniref:Uncharacterized protein n=1 Tax=Artomyces pyxidatus TaxID=48021 RepID=A0ACB8TAC7_9AGAM|nr:hypothetical protein BV25DRAFT_1822228 [Artomyces pyxidatus]
MAYSGSEPVPSLFRLDQATLLGPGFLSLFIQGIQTGVLIAQLSRFWDNSELHCGRVKALIGFVFAVASFQTCISCYSAWNTFVVHFGEWGLPDWVDQLEPALTLLMAAPTQAFLISRCWPIVKGNLVVIIPLYILLLSSVITNIMATQFLFRQDFTAALPAIYVPYVLCIAIPAILDIALTSILLIFLISSLKHVYTLRFRRTIYRLMIACWEVALPPTICAVILLVTYTIFIFHPIPQYIDIGLQAVLGKFYVMSLLFILNGRSARPSTEETPNLSTLTIPREGISWTRGSLPVGTHHTGHFVVSMAPIPPSTDTVTDAADGGEFAHKPNPPG